jgi:acetylornithine deacetylase/succinyl-diaminopimelate desuccinylase family protein
VNARTTQLISSRQPAPDRSRAIGRLERLIAFDTQNPPGRELEAVDYLAAVFRNMGWEAQTIELAPGRANLVAALRNGDGPAFAFNSHVDVVPTGSGWTSDPFKLTAGNGNLYGRGACDAKGQVACMIEACELLTAMRDSWCGTLLAVFVADEEVASMGARAYAAIRPKIDFCIIGEPTSNTVAIAHKGSMRPLVRVNGVPAHSGSPERGVNPLYKAARLLQMIERAHEDLRSLHHPLLGSPSLTVTRLNGGHADNVTPENCDLLLDRRMVPQEDEEQVRSQIMQLLLHACQEHGVETEILRFLPTTGGATETDPAHPIVIASIEAARRNGVSNLEPHGLQGACDLVHFRSTGAQGVVLGPGRLDVAHKPDEYVPEDEFLQASSIHRDVVLSLLGAGK